MFNWINISLKSRLLISKTFNKIINERKKKEKKRYKKLKTDRGEV